MLGLTLLHKLLDIGERQLATGVDRQAALTAKHMEPYTRLRVLTQIESVHAYLDSASHLGAVRIDWRRHGDSRQIERVTLLDRRALAEHLQRTLYEDVLAAATQKLNPYTDDIPRITEILQAWSTMRKVRGRGPDTVDSWVNAANVLVTRALTGYEDAPMRVVSTQHFNDSKVIESLCVEIDALTSDSIDSTARDFNEVFSAIGLFKEPSPVLLAGAVNLTRARSSGLIDAPYIGLAPDSILGVQGPIEAILSVENLTTFHLVARMMQDTPNLVIYSAGMVSPSWRRMYRTLIQSTDPAVKLAHWGDIDEGGFRIASAIAAVARDCDRRLEPVNMDPTQVIEKYHRPASDRTAAAMQNYAAAAGWAGLGMRVKECAVTIEQEAIENVQLETITGKIIYQLNNEDVPSYL